jgi:hypothetical protein
VFDAMVLTDFLLNMLVTQFGVAQQTQNILAVVFDTRRESNSEVPIEAVSVDIVELLVLRNWLLLTWRLNTPVGMGTGTESRRVKLERSMLFGYEMQDSWG